MAGKRKPWVRRARAVAPLSLFVLVGLGLAFPLGTGTPSSFGWDAIAAVCPLGALESLVAGRSLSLRLVLGVAVSLLLIFLLGRAFCSWLCPVPRVGGLLRGKGGAAGGRTAMRRLRRREPAEGADDERSSRVACVGASERARAMLPPWRGKLNVRLDSRHAVLVGALTSSAVCGFPVFCLVCPIGLTFATFILIWRMLQFGDTTWGLIAFPLIVAFELTVLRKWCSKICPVGALMSLVPKRGRLFRVEADRSACLREAKGASCEACAAACPEGIDPVDGSGDALLEDCAKCRRCADACPASAIAFPLLKRR